ncbi:MAG: archaeal heat shock protein Hsp20 [Candidatus Bathyarchaeia archaeon]
MSWDEYPSWFRRRCRWPYFFSDWFKDVDEITVEIERMMEDMFKKFTDRIPESMVRRQKLSGGNTVRQSGPFIWGWSLTMGPDRKPVVREFGNLKPSTWARPWEPPFNLKEERAPLVDILEGEEKIRVVAELPGVEKENIKLRATGRTLIISVDAKERKYYKELELPGKVNPSSAKSSYKNGVLEVEFKRVEERPRGVRIEIE